MTSLNIVTLFVPLLLPSTLTLYPELTRFSYQILLINTPPHLAQHISVPRMVSSVVDADTMRVHVCRHCGETFEDYAHLRRHLDSHATLSNDTTAPSSREHTKTHVCQNCGLSFGRRDSLQRHVRTSCGTCQKCGLSFGRRIDLKKHTRRCSDGPPVPKRPRVETSNVPIVGDPIEPPDRLPFPDALSTDLLDVVREHWSTVRTRVARGPVQTRFNYRLTTLDTTALEEPLNRMFQEQTTAFKINLSYGFILRNKDTGRYRYYHASCNCCGRYLEQPSLITNRSDFDEFLDRIRETDVLQWAIAQRPDSAWVCELVTNATFFVNRIIDHPIGCVGVTLPAYVKNNKAVIGLERESNHSKRYSDNLCLFRCLALHRGCDVRRLEPAVAKLYADYDQDGVPMEDFTGVTLDDLYRVETTFKTNVCVYKLVKSDDDGNTTAELVRRSLCHYDNTLHINLHETHFSYIKYVRMYCHSYRCQKCGDCLWKDAYTLHKHERTCAGGVRRVYPGGVYHSTPSIFERLDDENIRVSESLRYYPYRATFDFECYFDTAQLPSDSDKVHWVARHVPLSVSVASNVPGHEQVQCLVTDGNPDKLVADMMNILRAMSDAAYKDLKDSYEDVLEQLTEAQTDWDEREQAARSPGADDANDKESRPPTNPYKTLMGQLYGWLHQLPVIGFNSGKYDLNAIKKFLIPHFITETTEECAKQEDQEGIASFFVIKRNNTFMCLSTDQLKFLDMTNYIAPGFSYDKYLKAYGCEVTKGNFPYEYMDCLEKLDDTMLPPKEAFYSRLKNEGISDDDYASCEKAWRDNDMTTLRDFLVWYNNRDVVPFLQAIHRQFAFYEQRGIDMFKQGISVPGLTLLYLFNDLPEKTYFTIFNEKNKDLHQLVKDGIVGGPSIVFQRYHEKGVTKIRQTEYGETARMCGSIVGYDANALYLWSLMQDMPTGWYKRRREENEFRPESAQLHEQMAAEWLTWESERTGHSIRHQVNGREKRIGKLPVDGWCSTTKTAYQYQGCYFHGCPCLALETNAVNGKPMTQLLAETRKNTAYLRHFVKVVELWECQWKNMRKDAAVKRCLDAAFPRRRHTKWKMTQQQILTDVRTGTLFGMIECDVRVPEELRAHFAEMQPVFKNVNMTRDDLGPFMRRYAEDHDIMTRPRRMLVGSFRHAAPDVVPGPRTRGDARLSGHRVRTQPVLPSVR